ncbi:unnamed protein product [Zymoseptoria tritici ST99CH_1A5]|uniref:Uncharacterized protein n=1 Tax=Zymoseptoria tritici ST99CH_1A5 TaxID=1276529 RepID=A0A1Y6LBA6_ZYMTR|nr:unnamed protein product [Zymoseptoria tritici ST99CH_1A5]
MASPNVKQLHWTQRIALVRHNLHTASRSGDFGFFKSLQASALIEGTNHFAVLTEIMNDDADTLLAAMDNLNGGLAFIFQDAFDKVYDNLKNSIRDEDRQANRSKLFVDITMQKNMADMAIDKLSASAIVLISTQPAHVQEQAANVYITGMTLIADCVQVVIKQLDNIEANIDDFIRLEESRNVVKASVVAANAGLKGIFYLMDTTNPQSDSAPRSQSIASTGSSMFRRLSNAFGAPAQQQIPKLNFSNVQAPATKSTPPSPSPVYRTPNYVRNSISAGCPTTMPAMANFNAFHANSFESHKLGAIPPTPAYEEADPFDVSVSPTMGAFQAVPYNSQVAV